VAPGCTRLGRRYEAGEGLARDLSRAAQLYDKGCSAGDTEGCALKDALQLPQPKAPADLAE